MANEPGTTRPTRDDCAALRQELRLDVMEGAIGITSSGFLVIIYAKAKKPPLIKFHGWPIQYRIGGGMPRACAA